MACCPHCRDTGKSSDGDEEAKVCSQCGGLGWVKKEGDHRALIHQIENQSYEKTLLGQTNFDKALTPSIRTISGVDKCI